MGFFEVAGEIYNILSGGVKKFAEYETKQFQSTLRSKNNDQLIQIARDMESKDSVNPQIMDMMYREMERRGIER